MNCEQTQRLLDAYLDGELDLVHNLEIDAHLRECSMCAITYKNLQTLQAAIKNDALYFRSPSALQKRIRQSLYRADNAKNGSPRLPYRWLPIVAVLVVVLIGWGMLRSRSMSSVDDQLTQEVLSSHLRSLMVNHLADVASTDQHTVKPWFDGKLDFAPTVIDLATQDFPLIGGRLDYIDGRPVAALVYQRRKHIINLFIWPTANNTESNINGMTRQGWQLFHWTQGGMAYWAVSDVSSSDLQTFAQQIQGQIAASPTP